MLTQEKVDKVSLKGTNQNGGIGHEAHLSHDKLKMQLHEEQFSQNTYQTQVKHLRHSAMQERFPHTGVGQKKKIKRERLERNQDRTCPWAGAVKEKRFPHPANLFTSWEIVQNSKVSSEAQRRAQ